MQCNGIFAERGGQRTKKLHAIEISDIFAWVHYTQKDLRIKSTYSNSGKSKWSTTAQMKQPLARQATSEYRHFTAKRQLQHEWRLEAFVTSPSPFHTFILKHYSLLRSSYLKSKQSFSYLVDLCSSWSISQWSTHRHCGV